MSGRPDSRIGALDAARAAAIALVVIAHALLPAMQTDIGWAVHQPAGTLAVDGAVWIIRAFVLPLFFLLSGFLAARVVARRGVAGLIRGRALRLAAPLAVFLVPVSLSMNALWDWGKAIEPARVAAAGAVPELRASEHAVTLGHLWFLYYLLVVSLVAALVVAAIRWRPARRPGGVALAVAAAVAAAAMLGWGGKLQLDTPLGFAIDGPIAGYHAAFFAWGWWLSPAALEGYGRRVWLSLIAAAALFAALLSPLIDGARPAWGFAASGAFTAASITAVLGLCARTAIRPGGAVRLVSAASYWTYVIHLPLLVLAQIALARAGVPALVAAAVAAAAVGAVCLASYRLWVRDTWLARLVA